MLSVDALCVEAEDVELLVLLAEAEVLEELSSLVARRFDIPDEQ